MRRAGKKSPNHQRAIHDKGRSQGQDHSIGLNDVSAAIAAGDSIGSLVLAHAPIGILVFKATGPCVFVNPAAAKIAGGTVEQLLGQNFRKLEPWKRDGMLAAAKEALATDTPVQREIHTTTTFGKEIWFEACYASCLSKGDKYLIVLIQDITDRKRAEIELLESKARIDEQFAELSNIYKYSPVGLCVLDRDLRYLRINERLAEMNGVPVEKHLGRQVREVIPELGKTLEKKLAAMFETGEPILDIEVQGETPKEPNVTRYWLASFIPLKSATGEVTGLLLAGFEITDRKRAEQALQESEKAHLDHMRRFAKEADRVLEIERAGLSRHLHDGVGQSLSSLVMRLAWVEKRVRPLDSALAGELEAASEQVSQIIQDVRSVAKDLRPIAVEQEGLVPAIRSYVAEFQRLSGIRCRVVVRPAGLAIKEPLATAIYRIIQEAMTNVSRHAQARHCDIRISASRGQLMLTVTDDGKGAEAAVLQGRASLGILGMRERAAAVEGTLDVLGGSHAGVTVRACFPCPGDSA